MHRLERPHVPQEFNATLLKFLQDCPPCSLKSENLRWERWKNCCQVAYNALRTCLVTNQNSLCAYCEVQLSDTNRQIEHFIPKSLTTRDEDWTLDFNNFLIVCKGNEYAHCSYYSDSPTREANYTCGHKKDNLDPRGKICNPYELPKYPVFREVYKDDGLYFEPDHQACKKANLPEELVASTIEELGLNCPNLVRRRKERWDDILKEIDDIIKLYSPEKKVEELYLLVEIYLEPKDNKLLDFYTTSLLCLAGDLPELIKG